MVFAVPHTGSTITYAWCCALGETHPREVSKKGSHENEVSERVREESVVLESGIPAGNRSACRELLACEVGSSVPTCSASMTCFSTGGNGNLRNLSAGMLPVVSLV